MSGDDETVAAVVPFAAAEGDASAQSQLEDLLRDAASGVFHQRDSRHAVLIHGASIELTRLPAR